MKISEDRFYDHYIPQENHFDNNVGFGGCLYETYGEEEEYIEKVLQETPKKVWTLVETDVGFTIVAGSQFINRFGYFITEKEWETGEEFCDLDCDIDE